MITNVKDFGALGNGSADDTDAIRSAVEAAHANGGGIIFFPPGKYNIDGAKNTFSKWYGTYGYGIMLYSNLRFVGSGWNSSVVLKANSTADTNVNQFMFFAGPTGSISDLSFENMSFYGNSEQNALNIEPYDYRNISAIFIGTLKQDEPDRWEGVTVDGLRVRSCLFTDWPGANVICLQDRNAAGPFSRDVLIEGNTFYDNRKADRNRDHSTVNIFADGTRVVNNRFALPETAKTLQKQVGYACELHGTASCFNSNSLDWYGGACIFSENLHHDCLSQSAVGNVCSNMTYRVFDIAVSGAHKTINQVSVIGNTIHFNTIPPLGRPFGAPFKWAITFYIQNPAVVKSLTFANNVVDGDSSKQMAASDKYDLYDPDKIITVPVKTVGVAGLWGARGDSRLIHLNVIGNEFRRMTYGVWHDRAQLATFAKHASIVGNRFEDFACLESPSFQSEPAVGAFYTDSHPIVNDNLPNIESVIIAHNHFVNDWNNRTYKYGTYIDNTIFFTSIGENSYHKIRTLNNGWGKMSIISTISRPAIPNSIFPDYGTKVTIDWGLANRFFITVTDNIPFIIDRPSVNGFLPLPADGTEIEVTLQNASGAVMGNISWEGSGYKTSWNNVVDKPANNFNRTLRFRYSSKFKRWIETSKTPVDVPN